MLSKQYRLKKRKSFNYIYRRGRHVGCELLTLVFVSAKMKNIKVGFSVSKKVGNSVVRHRAIRLMRAAARPLVDRIAPNHSLVFVAKEGIEKKHLTEIQAAMVAVLQKAGLICEK
ncbi:MAG: ribonuclease P protein component [Firmicutes bacterium]|nr:ribonuclease P protein component [Bacillota bacterium]